MTQKRHSLALVTGASAGIGAAFARSLAARGDDVVLVARRADRLNALAAELRNEHGIAAHVITADLSAVDAHLGVVAALDAAGLEVDTLINNAGYSLAHTYAKTSWKEQRDFVMTLVMAVCGLTHALLPGMIARKRGSIITVGSMAALSPGGAGHTLYPAAKSFVLKFSMSLDAELRAKGIRVTCTLPGFTATEFAAANGTADIMAKSPRGFMMTAERVVDEALKANARGKLVSIPGLQNQIAAGLMKLLPDGLSAAIIRRAAEKYRIAE